MKKKTTVKIPKSICVWAVAILVLNPGGITLERFEERLSKRFLRTYNDVPRTSLN